MKKKILIFGAGSIGNHFTKAFSFLGYEVYITDIDLKALARMKDEIYPKRYGKWDSRINQVGYNEVFKLDFKFEIILIGTPPETHVYLFKKINNQLKFKKILIEKPLSSYNQNYNLLKKYNNKNIFCGYNHSVSKSVIYLLKIVEKYKKNFYFLEVNWREGWTGILNAHFWLKNEFDSYLGNIRRGGGALQEHSHGLHLLLMILGKFINIKKTNFSSFIKFNIKTKKLKYDSFSQLHFNSKKFSALYTTDLISNPSNKTIEILGNRMKFSWIHNYKKGYDAVVQEFFSTNKKIIKLFKKNRSSEFVSEIVYLNSVNKKNYNKCNINLNSAIEVMNTIKKSLNEI